MRITGIRYLKYLAQYLSKHQGLISFRLVSTAM